MLLRRIACTALAAVLLFPAAFGAPPVTNHVNGETQNSDMIGGPDAYGYSYIDSNEPLGPEYNWVDITQTGTLVEGLEDNNTVGPFPIGFEFSFYDIVYTEFYICSNGFITFTGGQGSDPYLIGNPTISYPFDHNNEIDFFWSDLNPSVSGQVFYDSDGDGNLVVEFSNVAQNANPTETFTAEVILYPDGAILMQYHSFSDGFNIDLENIGMESSFAPPAPWSYLSISVSEPNYPHAGLAILFRQPQVANLLGAVLSDESGSAIEGAEVFIGDLTATTDVNGQFSFEGIESGLYTISFFADGYVAEAFAVMLEGGDNSCEVSLATAPAVALFDDFEGESALFVPGGNTPDVWQRGLPTSGPGVAHSGETVWATWLEGGYGDSENATLNSSRSWYVYDENAQLSYWHWYEYEVQTNENYIFDGYLAQVSTDDGESWQLLEPIAGYIESSLSHGELEAYGDLASSWRRVAFNLTSWAGQNVKFRLHHATSSSNSGWFGVAMDDFQLTGVQSFGGLVTNQQDSSPVEGALVELYESGQTTPFASVSTDETGRFALGVVPGAYTIRISKVGFRAVRYDGFGIVHGQDTNLDVQLEAFEGVTIEGTVMSADTPGRPVPNAIVTIPGIGLVGVTNGQGTFNLGEFYPGTFTFIVSHMPNGSMGFHDSIIQQVVVDNTTLPIVLQMLEILQPADFSAFCGDGYIELTWDEPLNHLPQEQIRARLEAREQLLATLRSFGDRPETAQISVLEEEVAVLRNHLTSRIHSTSELDDISSFRGYLLTMDGQPVTSHPMQETSIRFNNLQNNRVHSFAICADYGYPSTYRVWSPTLEARPLPPPSYEVTELEEFSWIELNPAQGGDGIPLNLDDAVYSGWIDMAGLQFVHYGQPFTRFNVSPNGWISFIHLWGAFASALHNDSRPWGAIAPFWKYHDPGDSQEEDAFYKIDLENEQIIVQWHTGSWPGPLNNVKTFQAVLNCSDNTAVLSYLHAEEFWDGNAGVGMKNNSGDGFIQYPTENIHDNCSVRFSVDFADLVNIHGTVVDPYTGRAIQNARVEVVDNPGFDTVSDTEGRIHIYALDNLNSPFSLLLEHDGYPSTTIDGITIPEESYEVDLTLPFSVFGLDEAPTLLAADVRRDNGPNLMMVPPGTSMQHLHLQHDNGFARDAFGWMVPGPECYYMTPFLLDGDSPMLLTSAEVRLSNENDFFWPWPDEVHDPVQITIWANGPDDRPGEVLYVSPVLRNSASDPFVRCNPGIEIPASGCWIGFHALEGEEGIVVDDQQDVEPWLLWYTSDGGASYSFLAWAGRPHIRANVVVFDGVGYEPMTLEPRAPSDVEGLGTDRSQVVNMASRMEHIGILPRTPVPSRIGDGLATFLNGRELDDFHGFNVYASVGELPFARVNEEPVVGSQYVAPIGSEHEGEAVQVFVRAMMDSEAGQMESVSSDTLDATYGLPPAPPSILIQVGADPPNLSVDLTWTAPSTNEDGTPLSDLADYRLYRNGELVQTIPVGTTTCTDVTPYAGYFTYWVTAVDEAGNESLASNTPLLQSGTPVFFTSFETADVNPFTTDNPYWELGTPTAGPGGPHNGTNAWATGLGGDSGDGEYAWLISDVAWPIVTDNAMLAYHHYYEYPFGSDGYVALVSQDGGQNWDFLPPLNDYLANAVTGLGNAPGFSGFTDGWRKVFFDLSPYEGESLTFAFLHGTSNQANHGFGVAIDDLELWGVAQMQFGGISGTVTDPTGTPILNVLVRAQGGDSTLTNANGQYSFQGLFAANLRFSYEKTGYWTESMRVVIPVDGVATNDVVLTYPQGTVDPTSITLDVDMLHGDSTATSSFGLTSSGSGVLKYKTNLRLPAFTTRAALFGNREYQFYPNNPDQVGLLIGVVAMENGFVVTSPLLHKHHTYNRAGVLQQSYTYPQEMWSSRSYSPGNIAYDPATGDLFGGNDNGKVWRFAVDLSEYELIGQVDWMVSAIAYDPADQMLYLKNWNLDLVKMDVNTGEVVDLVNPLPTENITGLGFMPMDPEGCTLWMFSEGEGGAEDGTLFRYNPLTGYVSDPLVLYQSHEGSASALDIGTSWQDGRWTIVTNIRSGANSLIEVFEGQRDQLPWIQLNGATSGELASGETAQITLNVDFSQRVVNLLPNQQIDGTILLMGENWPNAPTIALEINVLTTGVDETASLPDKFALRECYPNPFNPTVTVPFDLPQASQVKVMVYNLLGQEVITLVDEVRAAGQHKVVWNGRSASNGVVGSGIYFIRMDAPGYMAFKKVVMVK